MIAALLLAASAAAAPAYVSDPRVELLGVLQLLAERRPELPADPAYRAAAEKAFAPFKGHPAVALYREAADSPRGDTLAVTLLWYGEPPALTARSLPTAPPHADDAAALEKTLAALRDFSAKSRFAAFYAAHRADYERACSSAAAELGVADPLARLEAYLGLSLEAKARWVVSPLYVPSMHGSFIVPYPDPATLPDPGAQPFEVTTIVAWAPGMKTAGARVTQRHKTALWQEPLFVFVDPAMAAFDASLGGGKERFYGAAAACRERHADCVKSWLVNALARRLDVAAFGAPSMMSDGSDPERERRTAALAARLEEYEKDRARWPTLWAFLPRLLSVFPEDEKRAEKAPAAKPGVKRVKQLFPRPR